MMMKLSRTERALEVANYMSNMLLRDSDVMSMAHGLELRAPFLDTAVMEFAAAVLSSEGRRDGLKANLVLRKTVDFLVGQAIME